MIRKGLSIAVLVIAFGLWLPAQEPATNNQPADHEAAKNQLIQWERESWEKRKAHDASYFSEVLPADFNVTSADGEKLDKSAVVDNSRNSLESYDLSDFDVQFPSENTAVVKYTAEFHINGAKYVRHVTNNWELRDGQWRDVKCVFTD